jgi:outer membrane protein OmpA-like peptidoglycan-associated protein
MSRAFRVGVFIVLALLILATGIFLIGDKDILFSSAYRVKAEFQNAAGLNNGADVRVAGIHEGTVKHIELPARPDGKVIVVMKLRNSTRSIIRKDSIASIKTEGLLGNKYVEISSGPGKGEPVQDGDVIQSEPTQDISEQTSAIAAEAEAGAAAFHDNMEALKHNFLLRGFYKRRGYDDPSELSRHAISKLPPGPRIKEFDYDARKIFDKPESAKVKNKKPLDEAGKFLEDNKFGLAVVASTVGLGDTEKDRLLTEARAKVIRDYLVQNFKVDDIRIKTIGLGKSKEAGDSGRVQILVYPLKSIPPPTEYQTVAKGQS